MMTDAIRVAAVQMTSTTEVAANLALAEERIAEAADRGARLVVLPENFSFLGSVDAERLAAAEREGRGPAQDFLREQASRHGLWLVGGTIPVWREEGRACSRALLVSSEGEVVAAYDKIHLFDVSVPGGELESYRESATTVPGTEAVAVKTALGAIGIMICYDIRFPALAHRLGLIGMDILAVPAAFTVPTGRVHWKPLLTARAIESLSYVIASAQWGEHAGGRKTYGHSMIIDPWGAVLAECADGAGVIVADVDMMRLQEIRNQFPVLQHRRDL
jgi:nitrilase